MANHPFGYMALFSPDEDEETPAASSRETVEQVARSIWTELFSDRVSTVVKWSGRQRIGTQREAVVIKSQLPWMRRLMFGEYKKSSLIQGINLVSRPMLSELFRHLQEDVCGRVWY